MTGKPGQEGAQVRGAASRTTASRGPDEESHVMKALRYAVEKVNRENKHPDEPPLVMPGEVPER